MFPSVQVSPALHGWHKRRMRTLYHLPLSPYSRKVRLVLAEKRLPFDLVVEKVWERRPEYLAISPGATVPTLQEPNGLVIPDSGVICEYLDEAYPDTPLMGHTLADRVEVRRIMVWMDTKFAQEVTVNLLGEKFMKRLLGRGNPDAGNCRRGNKSNDHDLQVGRPICAVKRVVHPSLRCLTLR